MRTNFRFYRIMGYSVADATVNSVADVFQRPPKEK